MECSCVQHTLIPGTSKLFLDFLYNFNRVAAFYPAHFSDLDALSQSANAIHYPEERHARMASALREQNGDSPSLSEFEQPGTVAVVTGQQVGLFSGPAYTIFKALTAVRLAEHLKQQGVRAVPIFWLATEDHDLAEVDHAWVFNHEIKPAKISIANAVTNGGPVGKVEMADVPLAELRAALGDLPFADEVIERLSAAYRTGATLGSAFRSFLKDVLKDFDLLYLDPLAPAVRDIAAEFIRELVPKAPELVSGLRQRDKELSKAGYHAQVLVEPDASLMFLLSQGKRTPIRWKDGSFVTRERSYTPAELQRSANEISPNALLRPVMQDFLLPTVTYVGGPAEIAYLAQSEVLYRGMLGRMPVIYPRNGFTLLDQRAMKVLDRFKLEVPDVLDYEEKVKSRLAAQLVPGGLNDEFAKLRGAVSSSLGGLQSSLHGLDPTLAAASNKTVAKILYQIDKLARKTARESLRRDERAARDTAYLTNLIYPHRHLQERFYSIVPFLAQHGFDLPQKIYAQTQLACPDHMVRGV